MNELDNLSSLFGESSVKVKKRSLIDDPFIVVTAKGEMYDLMEGLSNIKKDIISSKKDEKDLFLEQNLKFYSVFLEGASDRITDAAIADMHNFCAEKEVFLDMDLSIEKGKKTGHKSFVMNLKVDTTQPYDFNNYPYYEDERTILRAMSG